MSISSPEQSPQQRRIALIAGAFFVITFLGSIPALVLYEPLLKHADYILGAGADRRVEFGAFLEVITTIANIGTAVVLFPIVKRQNESVALGYVASRVLESTVIVIGLISVLAVVTGPASSRSSTPWPVVNASDAATRLPSNPLLARG